MNYVIANKETDEIISQHETFKEVKNAFLPRFWSNDETVGVFAYDEGIFPLEATEARSLKKWLESRETFNISAPVKARMLG